MDVAVVVVVAAAVVAVVVVMMMLKTHPDTVFQNFSSNYVQLNAKKRE